MAEEKKILWIDDDVNGPELMAEHDALTDLNYDITPVTNPDQLDKYELSSYDCIIIDLSMPTGDKLTMQETRGGSKTGYVLLQRIRKKSTASKIVVYTAFDNPDVKKYCAANNIEYWNKSDYLADDFAGKVKDIINKV